MIVLAMLTGFNKIGSVERGKLKARQLSVCRPISIYLYVFVCACEGACVCLSVFVQYKRNMPGSELCSFFYIFPICTCPQHFF